jgi:hypothetical protein
MKTGTKVAIAVGSATAAGVILYLILRPSPASAAAPAPAMAPAPNSPHNQTVNMPTEPTTRATYSQQLSGNAAFQLKVGDTLQLKPAPFESSPMTASMVPWAAQNCPRCAWSVQVAGAPFFQFGRSTTPVVGSSNPVIQQIGDGLFKAVGSGTGTIDFIYADPSGNPVGAHYHVDVTVI